MQEASQFVPMHVLTSQQQRNRHCFPCYKFLQTRCTAVWTKATSVVACTVIGSLKEIHYMVHLAMSVTTVTLSAAAAHRFTTSRYLKHKYTHHIRLHCSSVKSIYMIQSFTNGFCGNTTKGSLYVVRDVGGSELHDEPSGLGQNAHVPPPAISSINHSSQTVP